MENGAKITEVPDEMLQNATFLRPSQSPEGALGGQNGAPANENAKQEQGRTRGKKQFFISIFKRTLGSIKASCEKTGIDRTTYYRWLKDPEFEAEVRQAWQERLEDVEQIANNLILAGNPAMIRHFLDRRHPDYMPRAKVEGPRPEEKTLEQIFDEAEWVDDAKIESAEQK